ncbi:PREDICTED: mucosal addressin cell adhesion molecule 1 [Chrysochloris asiatica]|uniref:Mucosal addressin cell adhesion molecule 1 n=1 Tax=Chrysochloris asiatica TaxID=185453 RepID=A0A9B0UB19_CHRAS|nr:PREDICTED: mucosal addressin cell adhesion molecule 1 [Chrysochloris asiatica]
MERNLTVLLFFCLGLWPQGHGQVLEVDPPGSEVAVALGGSQQFTCRLACPGGGASVLWRGLDTSLGNVQSAAGVSVLSVRNASLSAAGTRVCHGSCGKFSRQRTVRILVYAFPDQLSMSPRTLVSGRDQKVTCTANNVTPRDPDFLSFSLFLGAQELEGAQSLGREEEAQGDEDPLFHVTETWLLPPLETPSSPLLNCTATMRLPGLELSRYQAIPILHSPTSLEPPASTTPEPPTTTASGPPTSTSLEPPASTTPESPTTTAPGPPTSTSLEPPASTTPEPTTRSPCLPEILQPSALAEREAPWEILCKVTCGPPGVVVRWTQAPGGLEAYERHEAGAQAWLTVRQIACAPEGLFQCRVDPGDKVASLYVIQRSPLCPMVVQPPATLWTGILVLGLLLMMFLGFRLRRCYQRLG